MSEWLTLAAAAVLAFSGVPGLFLSRVGSTGQWVSTGLVAIGCLVGLGGVGVCWATGAGPGVELPSSGPMGTVRARVDGLSALFLIPVFLVSLLGSVYGLGYWRQSDHPTNGRRLGFFYGLLAAGMAVLLVAADGFLFLIGWEVMALAAFFLVTTEDHKEEPREAGWVYFVATHLSTLCLFGLFALLFARTGSLDLVPLGPDQMTPETSTALFVLALVGFGLKAGVMPLHVWLPGAHAAAPSHVSALMSGVIIKMGVYGIVRFAAILPHQRPEWGVAVLGLGAVSGVLGVAYAVGQHDLKRLLAYHSIENIGIIVMGVGLALLGRSLGRPDWVVLGMAGALLHVWNHALFKALLFLSAGSVVHATHTREIDHLGGLAKSMPATAFCFLAGAVAICGLPPLNGFVSEFLIYLGLFRTLGSSGLPALTCAFAVPALALIGGLALACFVKVYGAAFLGTARSEHSHRAHESGSTMLAPMVILVACCAFIGLFPGRVAPALTMGVESWAPGTSAAGGRLNALAPLGEVGAAGLALLGGLLVAAVCIRWVVRHRPIAAGATWGCGYAAPTERMQYTSSSFAQMLVRFFAWALVPRVRKPKPHRLGLFPGTSGFHSEVPDAVLDRAVLPSVRVGAWVLAWLRILQRGNVQAYLLYIFLTLLALLLWR
jgi:hydrogenase-4 component B